MSKEILSMKEIVKCYDMGEERQVILDHIHFSVREGEFVSILGPSGSGKSTMMNILGCLDVPTSGSYVLSGNDVERMDEAELAHIRNREVGFVFQSFQLLPRLTAVENVELPLIYAGVHASQRRERAQAMLERVGLAHKMAHTPNQLSGGQQQRVAIARALAAQPDIIFADEPTGNLDSKSGGEVMELLCNIRRELDKTLVVITHDSRIAKMADRQFVIVDGILSETGSGVEV